MKSFLCSLIIALYIYPLTEANAVTITAAVNGYNAGFSTFNYSVKNTSSFYISISEASSFSSTQASPPVDWCSSNVEVTFFYGTLRMYVDNTIAIFTIVPGKQCQWQVLRSLSASTVDVYWKVELANKTDQARTMYVKIADFITLVNYIPITVPPRTTCSATINDLPIGNIITGSVPKSVNFPFSISGSTTNKSLVISGADIQSDGKLNPGGSSSGVKVYPASSYISGSTWNAGSSSGSIPLTVDASDGKVGTWTSSMLATLTCS